MKQAKRIVLALLIATGAAQISSCASAPKQDSPQRNSGAPISEPAPQESPYHPKPLSPRCQSFCDRISDAATEAGHEELATQLCQLARCETGDKCLAQIRSPNRRYHGAFQFSSRTWHSQCGPIFARGHLAACKPSAKMSDLKCSTACTAEIVSQRGYGDWPTCGKRVSR